MINVVLYEPEIPANTGNIIRLCANLKARLHIIRPMGFEWDDKKLRRAGLDYHEFVNIKFYDNFDHFLQVNLNARYFAVTTKTSNHFHNMEYQEEDFLLFGPETRGLPQDIRESAYQRIRIPMTKESRSMNLSNSVAICLVEALRQLNFIDLE